jgi:hypothetical protein
LLRFQITDSGFGHIEVFCIVMQVWASIERIHGVGWRSSF